jgi:riboflavin biosynthesis pyrimidine reductase
MYGLGVTSLVLEGGPALHRAALDSDIVDAAHVYITPRPIGPGGVRWLDAGKLAWDTLSERHARWLGEDVLVEAQLRNLKIHVHRDH